MFKQSSRNILWPRPPGAGEVLGEVIN